MKNIIFLITSLLIFTGCSTTSIKSKPSINTTAQFRINHYSLKVQQKVTPKVKYHTEKEIKKLTLRGIKQQLKEANLLSTDKSMDSLDIKIIYYKKFVGDATFLSSDALAYPGFDIHIVVKHGKTVLTTISEKNLTYSGSFFTNLKVLASALRDKSDEAPFIEALSTTVAEYIKDLKS